MRKTLIPFDGSEQALHAVRLVTKRHLTESSQDVHLLFVSQRLPSTIGSYFTRDTLDDYYHSEAEKQLAEGKALLERCNVPCALHHRVGPKAETIVAVAKQLGVDDILIGTGRKSAFTRLVEGSLTQELMRVSDVPVEVITYGSESAAEKYGLPAGLGAAIALMVAASE